jgi:glycosyltransferase involved in cell wall biosynthesis
VHLFARLDPVKGGRRLVEIADELRRRAPDVRVVAFGGGPFDDAARSAGVEVLRPVDRSGVAAALHTADVVIGQQMIPMLGLSELEAMACAKPVIAPVSLGAYDVAPPVVVADGVAATVERCLDLLDRPSERAEIGAAGRAYVGAHHSHAVVGARLATLYDRVAGAS